MDVRLIYMTAGSREEARNIGRHLVENGLVACVNIFDNINSLYLWEDQLQDDVEVVMTAKTTRERVAPLMDAVRAMHSYDCPCILSLPIEDGNAHFLEWIAGQVKPD